MKRLGKMPGRNARAGKRVNALGIGWALDRHRVQLQKPLTSFIC
jgi:hypothetical protein